MTMRWRNDTRECRVNDYLKLVVRFNDLTNTWYPSVILEDRIHGTYFCEPLQTSRHVDWGGKRTVAEAQKEAEQTAKSLGDVRPWMALFRCFAGNTGAGK